MGVRKTTENFIFDAKLKHGNQYDYSLVNYSNSSSKIKIICSNHGIFEQRANTHFSGRGCSICSGNAKSNTIEFLKKVKLIHGDKYDYSLVEYINGSSKIKIICTKHGMFEQVANGHLNKQGCPICNESKGEKEISNYLNNKKIKFIRQHIFSDCKNKRGLPFDFYLPDLNICLEFNGKQHYQLIPYWDNEKTFQERLFRDKIKLDYCEMNKIELIIIKFNENIYEKINNYIKNL